MIMKKRGNENEMKMKIKWDEKLLNQDVKRGTQKKREGENTNTWNLAQNGQPWKGKGKEKRRQTDTGQDQRRGEKDGRAWTNLPQRNLHLPKP